MIFSVDGKTPKVHPTAFVAPTAVLIGDVTIEADASVWFGAILRGDAGAIVIGEGTNVQDGAVLHEGATTGKRCVLAHQVLVHRAFLGDDVLIANGALVFGDVKVGDGAIVGAGAVLVGPVEVPPKTLWLGIPAKQVREANETLLAMTNRLQQSYLRNRQRYLEGLTPVDASARSAMGFPGEPARHRTARAGARSTSRATTRPS